MFKNNFRLLGYYTYGACRLAKVLGGNSNDFRTEANA
jgi:hypothetical protein